MNIHSYGAVLTGVIEGAPDETVDDMLEEPDNSAAEVWAAWAPIEPEAEVDLALLVVASGSNTSTPRVCVAEPDVPLAVTVVESPLDIAVAVASLDVAEAEEVAIASIEETLVIAEEGNAELETSAEVAEADEDGVAEAGVNETVVDP